MNNQREIYEALLAGETLIHCEHGNKVAMSAIGFLSTCGWTFDTAGDWSVHKEPKWYENIPEGGVLCWTDKYKSSMTLITVYVEYQKHPFKGHCSHENPNPLTKSEIQAFIDSAPQ